MGRQSILPRFVHHFWARLRGYFWAPCPICGRKFGGHEQSGIFLITEPNGGGWMVCRDPECINETRRRNLKFQRSVKMWLRDMSIQ